MVNPKPLSVISNPTIALGGFLGTPEDPNLEPGAGEVVAELLVAGLNRVDHGFVQREQAVARRQACVPYRPGERRTQHWLYAFRSGPDPIGRD